MLPPDPHPWTQPDRGKRPGAGRQSSAAIAPSPSPSTAPPAAAAAAAAAAFLGPGRPGRRRWLRRRCEADGGPGRPPPRRRGSRRGGVFAPPDPSSETPCGPLMPLFYLDPPQTLERDLSLPRSCNLARPRGPSPESHGCLSSCPRVRRPPAPAKPSPHILSSPQSSDALDLAVASDQQTGPLTPAPAPGVLSLSLPSTKAPGPTAL
jgi:hypothetical protein